MTVKEWAAQQSGVVLKIPAGTVTGHRWWYLEDGAWTTKPIKWVSGMTKEYRPDTTTKDQYIELKIVGGTLEDMAYKACTNRSGRSVDGPLVLKRQR